MFQLKLKFYSIVMIHSINLKLFLHPQGYNMYHLSPLCNSINERDCNIINLTTTIIKKSVYENESICYT